MISYAGSVQAYVKSLETQWNAKKKYDEFSGKKQSVFTFTAPDFALGLNITNADKLGGVSYEEVDYRLSQIIVKLKRGKELSGSELDYLRQKNPALYEKALKIQEERKEYEMQLRRCKTKEDVHRLNAIKGQLLAGEAKKAGQSGDAQQAENVEMRFNAIKDAYETFINSRAFDRLPGEHKELEYKRAREKKRMLEQEELDEQSEEAAEPDTKKQSVPNRELQIDKLAQEGDASKDIAGVENEKQENENDTDREIVKKPQKKHQMPRRSKN